MRYYHNGKQYECFAILEIQAREGISVWREHDTLNYWTAKIEDKATGTSIAATGANQVEAILNVYEMLNEIRDRGGSKV